MLRFTEFLNEEEKVLRIRLHGFGNKTNSERSEKFMKDFHDTSSEHPIDHKKRLIHNVGVHVSTQGNAIHIHDLQSALPDSGNGTKALKHLTGLADKHGVKLELHAKAYSNHPEHIRNSHTLQKWYKKHGFEHDEEDDGDRHHGSDMTYYPK